MTDAAAEVDSPAAPGKRYAAFRSGIETLHPGYFGLVMATGIVSIAAHMQALPWIAKALFALNLVQYTVLCVLYGLRLVWFTKQSARDFSDHLRAPGYFTAIAGSGVLGSQSLIVAGLPQLAIALLVLTVLCWCAITYGVLTALIVKEEKPGIEKGINGAWLIAIVGTQSVSVLASLIAARMPDPPEELLMLAVSAWCFGAVLYVWIISLIFYRYMFFRFAPSDLTPPYWINMGALAISTLAGAGLIGNASDSPLLLQILPFIKGVTLAMWATATWWIPMLILLGFWRHVLKRFPLRYDPMYWGMVFPLGMYSASTFRFAQEMALPFLVGIPTVFLYVALFAWVVTYAGMLHRLGQTLLFPQTA